METMFHNKVSSNSANWSNSGKTPKLPPRIPLPSTIQGLREGGSSMPNGKMHNRLPKDDRKQHQRTSSESFIIEEQPSWLEDLLNEPEIPSGRGTHRRSSSDSVAYMDIFSTSSKMQGISQLEFSTSETPSFLPSSVSLPFYMQRDMSCPSSFDISSASMPSVRGWKSSVNPFSYHNCVASMEDSSLLASFGCSFVQQDMDNNFTTAKQEREKSSEFDDEESAEREENMFLKATANVDRCDQKGCFGKDEECSHDKPRATGSDPKRTKQHFAQRSRVRKLQYIAELERTVSILHVEISDVAAELAFLKQRHFILILENKALVQRITTIAHEKKIKDVQHDLLQKEVDRLRGVYCNRRRETLKPHDKIADAADHLDLQFSCLSLGSLNQLETGSVKEPGCVNRVAPHPCMMLQKS